MEPGSVGAGGYNPALAKQVSKKVAEEKAPAEEVAVEKPVTQEPQDMTTLAARFKVPTEKLAPVTDEHGNQTSEMEIFVAPKTHKSDIEALGGVLVDTEQVISDEGLDPDGHLELTSVEGTGNKNTVNVVEPFEVKKSDLEVDPETNTAPIENMSAVLLREGEGVLAKGQVGVPEGSVVAPQGYTFDLADSAASAKTKKQRKVIGKVGDIMGTIGQSGMVGLLPIPGGAAVSGLLSLGTMASWGDKSEAVETAQKTLGYLQQRQKTSENDVVTLEVGGGQKLEVSGTAHQARLETMVRQAKGKLLSSRILAGAGATSVIGLVANAGAFGTGAGALAVGTAATAAAPYLAGAAMVAGTGGMVFDSVAKLRTLSKEKAELQKLLDAGETHVDKAVEKQTAEGLKVKQVEVPINERLEQIGKESRKHRLMATAMGGGMISITGTVVAGGGLAMAPLALGPAAVVAGAHSLGQLKKLHGERAELTKLQEAGEKMVTRDVENFDGSWKTTKVPISNLMADIKKKQKTQGMILTSTASITGMMGLSLAGSLSLAAAAPLVMIPAALGYALFPDKVHEFVGKVAGFVKGFGSEESKTRKNLVKMTQERTEAFHESAGKLMAPLVAKNPALVNEFPSQGLISKMRGQGAEGPPAGYLTVVNAMVNDYANKGSREARAQAMAEIKEVLGQAPAELKSVMPAFAKQIEALHMDTEAAWVARDIALEMKTPMTEKVVGDKRVGARLDEIGYGSNDVKPQYKEVLELESDDVQFQKTLARHQAGDKEATRQLTRQQIFASARAVHAMERDLGKPLFTKVVDAIHRPHDQENMELVTKEVSYKMRDPGSLLKGPDRDAYLSEPNLEHVGAQIGEVANALAILQTPKTFVPDTQQDLDTTAHRALQAMVGVDPEASLEMGTIQGALHNPETFKGMSSKEMGAKTSSLKKRFDELRDGFPDTEMVDYWLDTEARARRGPSGPDGGVTQRQLDREKADALRPLSAIDEQAAAKLVEVENQLAAGFEGMSAPDAQAARTKLGNQYNLLKGQFNRTNPEAFKAYEVASEKAKAGPPAQIAAADAVPEQPLQGASARMANAFSALRDAEPKWADRLGKAFSELNDPQAYEGLSQEAAVKKKSDAAKELTKAKAKLAKKEPEMMALWETARKDVEEEHFERSIDREFLGQVLNQPTVTEATAKLELKGEDAEALLMGLQRSQVLGKQEALNEALADESGEKVDPKKQELLGVIDAAIVKTAADRTQGGADQVDADATLPDPLEDPAIVNFLKDNPVVEQVLTSNHLVALAEKLKVSPHEAQMEFLKLQQVDMNPVATAEFQGRLDGGDLSAVKTLEVGRAVGGLINELTRPNPEMVAQMEAQLEAQMKGPGVAIITGNEQIQDAAKQLNVDLTGTLKNLIRADLMGDPSYVQNLQAEAQRGVTAAQQEFQMVQILSNAIMEVNQAAAAAAQQGEPPQAA